MIIIRQRSDDDHQCFCQRCCSADTSAGREWLIHVSWPLSNETCCFPRQFLGTLAEQRIDVWRCLEFQICFIDCQSDIRGIWRESNNADYDVASDGASWANILKSQDFLSSAYEPWAILNISTDLSASLQLLGLVRDGSNPQCRFKQRFALKHNQPVPNAQAHPQQTGEEESTRQDLYPAGLIMGTTASCAGRQVREQGRAAPADDDGFIRAGSNKRSYLSLVSESFIVTVNTVSNITVKIGLAAPHSSSKTRQQNKYKKLRTK